MFTGPRPKLFALAAIAFSIGCAHKEVKNEDMVPIVKRKASAELSCPEDQLKVVELEGQSSSTMGAASQSRNFDVEGCEQRATYEAHCVKGLKMQVQCWAARDEEAATTDGS